LVLFKSKLMQNILKQNCSGTILTAVNKNEFLNIELPIVIKEKQQQIASLIQQSFSLKKQSEHLLEVAKRAVEIAIEEDEAAALAYIQQQTDHA
ncbi:MAG: restriction endonuclease subunit S, partial [Ghiorsea sp.]